jgi:hypothetical protein
MTAAEYLAWEREQKERHEYVHGEVFCMAGGSPRHAALIAGGTLARVKLRRKLAKLVLLVSTTGAPLGAAGVLLLPVSGCTNATPATSHPSVDAGAPMVPTCTAATTLQFVPEIGDKSEGYVCFGFDAGALAASAIGGVLWTPPAAGALLLHHATLYAVTVDFPDGPVACDGMPAGSVGLHVWTPGGSDLVLPSDTGLRLPAGTKRFVVEAHTLRVGTGPVEGGRVSLCTAPAQPAHFAALMSASAPVPAIRPEHLETSEATCTLAGDLHLWSVWPHMHLVGKEIAVDLLHGDGSADPLVDVRQWDFHLQKTYPLSVDVHAGDRIHTRCTWQNPSRSYVLPGLLTENEMCNVVLIAWPAHQAQCR